MRARLMTLAMVAVFAVTLIALVAATTHGRDLLIYNPSASMPVGFYVRAARTAPLRRGAIVTVRAQAVAPDFAAARDFADANDRFLKRVAASSGDIVCADRDWVSVNGAVVAQRQDRDSQGRILPRWSGCARLDNEVLLLGDSPDSFDGRYWGPTDTGVIEGVWRPLGS